MSTNAQLMRENSQLRRERDQAIEAHNNLADLVEFNAARGQLVKARFARLAPVPAALRASEPDMDRCG